jgi:poly(A) polymerase|tara:strand:- start:20711 stop:22069 length:1359 start_codon:yes stop_codon:yes gene_type:complete
VLFAATLTYNVEVNINRQQSTLPQKTFAQEHNIDEQKICKHAKRVVKTLTDKGYQAYLVGGCVRDLLLNMTPKDFDIATNATPEEVRRLFDRSRIIGRRFQIVHVYYGREFLEVSTFRAQVSGSGSSPNTQFNNGQITRDNTFGDIDEDALRRDFTINALYYDLTESAVLDFCSGMDAVEKRYLRMIGDPSTRYREDPVRMLRAMRFRAKLGLEIETDTAAPIAECAHLLTDISSARLFDETIKLFHSGHAVNCFHELKQHGLFHQLFPMTEKELGHDPQLQDFIVGALGNTDARINIGKSVNPAFIFAVLLWRSFQHAVTQRTRHGKISPESIWDAGRNTIFRQASHTTIPKRFAITICEIWKFQSRFERIRSRQIPEFIAHPRFRAAYDFMCLRTLLGEVSQAEADWWTDIQACGPEEKQLMIEKRPEPKREPKAKSRASKSGQQSNSSE